MMSIFKIEEVANIIRDAGGSIVGRTKLQKVAYLLSVTGLDNNFSFSYKHYGPFSENLASSAKFGAILGNFSESQNSAAWGGTYSIYYASGQSNVTHKDKRRLIASEAAKADSIELELAATAVFLAKEGFVDPWSETARRKPDKATGARIRNAKILLEKLQQVEVPIPLPNFS